VKKKKRIQVTFTPQSKENNTIGQTYSYSHLLNPRHFICFHKSLTARVNLHDLLKNYQ